ncbi:hypothetical protein J4443_01325 [Candidatus Woesearchaeota archaeon]|nr:hypothetical protein [Candidatus Woesearchaeota archaeon]
MKQKQTIENHVWEPLKEHEIRPEDQIDYLEARGSREDISVIMGILQHLAPNEYLPVYNLKARERDVSPFHGYIEALRSAGLDVGKGDAEYGFRMPLPENGQSDRELIIFRRNKKSR